MAPDVGLEPTTLRLIVLDLSLALNMGYSYPTSRMLFQLS